MAKKRNNNGAAENNSAAKPPNGAAYFLSLTLRNIRCFGDEPQTLKLIDKQGRPARWTVLLGNNGTGKTTVLQSLTAFEPIPLTPETIQEQFPAAYLWQGAPPRFILHQLGKDVVREGKERGDITVHLGIGKPLSVFNTPFNDEEISFGTNGVQYMFRPPHLPPSIAFQCYGYGSSRRFSLKGLPNSELDDSTASLFSDDANLRNAEDWLLTLDYSASKKSDIQERQTQQRDLVTDLLIEILPDVDDIRFLAGEGTHPKPRVEAKTPYGWVPLRQLGHGYRTLIAWIVDLVSRLVERYPDTSNPLEAPGIVLVDEIDLHMHPLWQRKLMGELTTRFPNVQFIVTAHSPLIVQAAAEDANIALLRREGDHVVIDNDLGYIRGWSIDQLLTSDLFGLPSSRPPQFDERIERRKQLLMKSKLTKDEKRELAELEEVVFSLPGGETAEQAKTSALIHETLELLKKNQSQPQ